MLEVLLSTLFRMTTALLWTFGMFLTAAGVFGFVPGALSNNLLLGLFEVDTLHNVLNLMTGVFALHTVYAGGQQAQRFFRIVGVVYTSIAVIGFLQGDTVLGLIATTAADHVVHLVVGVVSLWTGFLYISLVQTRNRK